MEKIKKNQLINNIKIFLFFLYLLAYYIFGNDSKRIIYSEIILLMFIILEVMDIFKIKKIKYNIPIIFVFMFSFYCFLSNFWAINSEIAISKSYTLFILSFFLLITYNFFSNIENAEEKILKTIMYVGILFSCYIIAYYGIPQFITRLISGGRIGEEINNVNSIGMQVSISVIIAIFYGLYEKKNYYFFLALIPLAVSLGTGSRKVILLIAIGTMMLFLLKKEDKKNILKSIKKIVLFSIILIAFVYILQLPMFETIYDRMKMTIDGLTGRGSFDHSTQLREMYIKDGMQEFFKNPILGIGIENSRYITKQSAGIETYLHNNYVELLATTGIIGFTLYYFVYFYIILNCIKLIKKKNKYINIVFIIFIINLILEYGMVSYYNKNTYIYILLGLITIERNKKNEGL